VTAVAALVLVVVCLPACLLVTARGGSVDRLVGLEVLGVVSTVVLLLLADAFGRSVYMDVALVLALLSFAGSLVFARFLGRSL
jgi:multicomponent Na+:H+ antiporter subunit F